MSPAPAIELLVALRGLLAERDHDWYVFGAQAVLVHGRPRMTADVDVTVQLRPDDVVSFVADMGKRGFVLRIQEDVEGFLAATSVLPFNHEPTGLPLDVVVSGPGLEERFLQHAELQDLGGVTVPVISPEHLIVTKILAGRPKDLEDAQSVCKLQEGSLKIDEVRSLLVTIEKALDQSDLLPKFEAMMR